jgi:cellulase
MKSIIVASALAIQQVAGHAIFQDLWVNGVDKASTCVRMPGSNSPVSSVSSNDLRCNAGGSKGVAGKCAVAAGDTVTVEMHQVNPLPQAVPNALWP